MTIRCPRFWEVEAAKDGRLRGDALESLIHHLARCRACSREARYVEALGRDLRDHAPPAADEIAVRGLRQRILSHVDAELAGRSIAPPRFSSRSGSVRARLAALAFVATVIGVVGHRATRGTAPAPHVAPTTVEVTDEGGARYTRVVEGDVERFDLREGALGLAVQRGPGGARVVVHVPDGEIEDLGTVFHVVVADGHTTRVRVEVGRVTLRLVGAPPRTLDAGEAWEWTPPPPASAPAVAVAAKDVGAPRAAVSAPLVAPGEPRMPAPPANAAEEDEAYLHVIRLLRGGRQGEARAAARLYLRTFPDGFRREEMGRVAE